ncbi:MAG: acyl-CoA dehydrogenase family protein [Gammaproteobacteria bacterium]
MNEERQILQDSVNRLFSDRLGWDQLTAIEESGFPADLWEEVSEQGITKVIASEAAGGMAGSWADAYVVLHACGRHGVPLPVAETIICEWLARSADFVLPDVAIAGLLERPITAEALSDGTLQLTSEPVPWGRQATCLVGVTEGSSGSELVVADAAGLTIEPQDNIGRDPRDRLSGSAAVLARLPLALPADCVAWYGALARSAQIAGGGAACLDLALKFTGEREQFGRPLAAFQAIQHYLSDLAGTVCAVDAIAMAACHALDERGINGAERNARFEIAAAKCRASEAVEKLTRLSHQVHGAIGFTYEYGLHFTTRRLWSWRAEFGSAAHWGAHLGAVACQVGGNGIWGEITG